MKPLGDVAVSGRHMTLAAMVVPSSVDQERGVSGEQFRVSEG